MDDVILNDVWTYYFHDPADGDWTCSSYTRLCDVSSVREFWGVHSLLKNDVQSGMFFVMREHVFPCWDDPHNIDGGCVSIKVPKADLPWFWEDLCVRMLGETLTTDPEAWNVVNGISTSPKRNFCIVKIWLADAAMTDPKMFAIPSEHQGSVFFKLNRDNMDSNHATKKIEPISRDPARNDWCREREHDAPGAGDHGDGDHIAGVQDR